MELAPNIHWIEGVKGNVYACFDYQQVTLIGSGRSSIDRIDLIFNYIAREGYYPIHLSRIIITHIDADQVGNIAEMQKEARFRVYATAETRAFLMAGQLQTETYEAVPKTLFNWPRTFTPVNGETIHTIKDGDTLPIAGGLQVIATPGFTIGHIALYSAKTGVLFAGEVFNTTSDVLHSEPPKITMYAQEHQKSIRRLLALCPTVIAGSQGAPLQTHTATQLLHTHF